MRYDKLKSDWGRYNSESSCADLKTEVNTLDKDGISSGKLDQINELVDKTGF